MEDSLLPENKKERLFFLVHGGEGKRKEETLARSILRQNLSLLVKKSRGILP